MDFSKDQSESQLDELMRRLIKEIPSLLNLPVMSLSVSSLVTWLLLISLSTDSAGRGLLLYRQHASQRQKTVQNMTTLWLQGTFLFGQADCSASSYLQGQVDRPTQGSVPSRSASRPSMSIISSFRVEIDCLRSEALSCSLHISTSCSRALQHSLHYTVELYNATRSI